MNARTLEVVFLVVILLAVLVGGRALVVEIAQFHGLTVSVLGVIAIFLVYAFRRNYLAGGALARLHATRDAAFLAALAATIVFVLTPARWSLGAAVVAFELALVVELLGRLAPPAGAPEKER